MPNNKDLISEEEKVRIEIAELYPLLTADDRRKIAVAINQDARTMERYANPTYGVKKLATGILMRDAMRKVLAARQTQAA